jgi:hypothetical protein
MERDEEGGGTVAENDGWHAYRRPGEWRASHFPHIAQHEEAARTVRHQNEVSQRRPYAIFASATIA